jgi:PAS domain S-box-containing protein
MAGAEWSVLIVDDCLEDRNWLKYALAKDRNVTWRTKEAVNVKTGLLLAEQEHFDCIVVDHHMPDRTGLDFLDALKGTAGETQMAVVLLTGRGDEKLATLVMKSGALDYVSKNDLTGDVICQALRNAIDRFQLRSNVRELQNKARLESEEALREYRFLADFMPQMVFTCKPDGSLEYQNPRRLAYTGIPADQQQGNHDEVYHPDDLPSHQLAWAASLQTGEPFQVETRLRRDADGSYRWHLIRAVPFRNAAGDIVRWIGTSTDVHEQKTQSERLETEVRERTEMLHRSLRQKDLLLREVHHRVKNNLQVITSLLQMQARALQDEKAASALRECEARVLSMALVYERLNRTGQIEYIEFSEYVQALVNELFLGSASHSGRITSKFEVSEVILSVDQAMPLGLLINELVTNALKHAYPDGAQGEVLVELKKTAPGYARLRIADKGIGLPIDLDQRQTHSVGLLLVEGLVKQLGATLAVESGAVGTVFSVDFPER